MICDTHVPIAILVKSISPPPNRRQNYDLRNYLCLCLPCFAFAGCLCIPLHPYELIPTLLNPSLPLYVCAHICVFLRNFPVIHGQESYPANPFLCLFVLFACALVLVHPTAPIQTHIHPYPIIITFIFII